MGLAFIGVPRSGSLDARVRLRRIRGGRAASGAARIARGTGVRRARVANGIHAARLHHDDFVKRDRRGFGRSGFRDRASRDAGTVLGETTAESAFATDESRRRGKNQEGNDQRLFHIALA